MPLKLYRVVNPKRRSNGKIVASLDQYEQIATKSQISEFGQWVSVQGKGKIVHECIKMFDNETDGNEETYRFHDHELRPINGEIANGEIVEVLQKRYNLQDGVGKAKYVVNFHDGIKTHKDGSRFFDLKTFTSKRLRDEFVRKLQNQGFTWGIAL